MSSSRYRETDERQSGVSASRQPVMRNLLLLHNRGYGGPNFRPVLTGGFIYIVPISTRVLVFKKTLNDFKARLKYPEEKEFFRRFPPGRTERGPAKARISGPTGRIVSRVTVWVAGPNVSGSGPKGGILPHMCVRVINELFNYLFNFNYYYLIII